MIRTVTDQVGKANALFFMLNKPGVKRLQDGGERIEAPLRMVKSSAGGWYENYDPLNVDPQEPLTKAYYVWRQLYYSVTMSRKEERQNSGEGRFINFLQSITDDAVDALTEDLNTGMFALQSGKALSGLQSLVPVDPTSGTVGGINRANESWWRNQYKIAGTSLTWDVLQGTSTPSLPTAWVEMESLFLNCSKGGGPKNRRSPNMGMANQEFYKDYITGIEPQRRFSNTELARVGFQNIMFNDMPIAWDESCESNGSSTTVGCLYMLNTNFIHLYVDSQTDFHHTKFVRPYNQDARAMQILWMGNLCLTASRKHGVLEDV